MTAAVVHVVRGIGLARLVDFTVYRPPTSAAMSSRATASQVAGPQRVGHGVGAVAQAQSFHQLVLVPLIVRSE